MRVDKHFLQLTAYRVMHGEVGYQRVYGAPDRDIIAAYGHIKMGMMGSWAGGNCKRGTERYANTLRFVWAEYNGKSPEDAPRNPTVAELLALYRRACEDRRLYQNEVYICQAIAGAVARHECRTRGYAALYGPAQATV